MITMIGVSIIMTQCEWVHSYRLQETTCTFNILLWHCSRQASDMRLPTWMPFSPAGPSLPGWPWNRKKIQELDWLSAAANTSLLYYSLMEISECNQPEKKRKRQQQWEWSPIKISLCVTKLCRTIQGALSETHSNVSDCNLKLILGDEKSLTVKAFILCVCLCLCVCFFFSCI